MEMGANSGGRRGGARADGGRGAGASSRTVRAAGVLRHRGRAKMRASLLLPSALLLATGIAPVCSIRKPHLVIALADDLGAHLLAAVVHPCFHGTAVATYDGRRW